MNTQFKCIDIGTQTKASRNSKKLRIIIYFIDMKFWAVFCFVLRVSIVFPCWNWESSIQRTNIPMFTHTFLSIVRWFLFVSHLMGVSMAIYWVWCEQLPLFFFPLLVEVIFFILFVPSLFIMRLGLFACVLFGLQSRNSAILDKIFHHSLWEKTLFTKLLTDSTCHGIKVYPSSSPAHSNFVCVRVQCSRIFWVCV